VHGHQRHERTTLSGVETGALFGRAVVGQHGIGKNEQRACFDAGQGGALVPLMSVHKTPEELGTFAALVEESRRFRPDWAIVFVAGLSGRDGRAPTSEEADRSLQQMIESIQTGSFGSFIPFDRQGQPVLFN
jgi:hypothetical protein